MLANNTVTKYFTTLCKAEETIIKSANFLLIFKYELLFQILWKRNQIQNLAPFWNWLEIALTKILGNPSELLYLVTMMHHFIKLDYNFTIDILWFCLINEIIFLFKGIIDHKCFEQETGIRILYKMSELLKLEYNTTFLEWIFDKCKERDLVKKCQQFSAENQFQFKCFDTKVTPRK